MPQNTVKDDWVLSVLGISVPRSGGSDAASRSVLPEPPAMMTRQATALVTAARSGAAFCTECPV